MPQTPRFTVRTLTEDCEVEAEIEIWPSSEYKNDQSTEAYAWLKFDDFVRVASNNCNVFGWISTVQLIGSDDTVIHETRVE